jgi:hypothetical protein
MAKGSPLGSITQSVSSFLAMADLATHDERKRALLGKLDGAYKLAERGRGRVVHKPDSDVELFDPDTGGMVKCIELAARLMGVLAESERAAKNGDGETRGVEIDQLVSLLKSIGYRVEKAA